MVTGFSGYALGAYAAAVVASLGLLVVAGRQPTGMASVTFVFVGFFLAYGLIAPVGAFAGLRIFLPPPYATDQFIAHYCLATAGLIIGISCARVRTVPGNLKLPAPDIDARVLLVVALVCAAAATVFEVVNVVRAGGIEIVFAGKLAYQSAVTNLTGTLPAEFATRLAIIVFALWFGFSRISAYRRSLWKFVVFAVLIAPVLAVFVVLGRRTEILALLLCVIVAITYLSPIRRPTRRLITVVVGLYLLFVILFVLRETVFHHSGEQMTVAHFTSAALHALFPATGEFGAPFAVFSAGIKHFSDTGLAWGGSYLDGLALVVPSFLYPGDKPIQLDAMLFRLLDPSGTEKIGTVAGYGFSPLLEARINFGTTGVFFVYLLGGYFLQAIERMRTTRTGFAFAVFYLLIVPLGQMFHRSTFGNAVLSPALWILFSVVIAVVLYQLVARLCPPRPQSPA